MYRMIVGRKTSLLVAAAFPILGGPALADPFDTAVLQALDKVTARVSTLKVPVDGMVRFGTLDIAVRTCDKRPPEEPPESVAFLDIRESRTGEVPRDLFRGWMFASSPALSSLEHPVYDVWVLDCVNSASSASASGPSKPAR